MTRARKLILILLLIGFAAMEFPGILIVGKRTEPMIFGLPFLYGYLLCCWAFMLLVLFYAWRTRWGSRPFLSAGNRSNHPNATSSAIISVNPALKSKTPM